MAMAIKFLILRAEVMMRALFDGDQDVVPIRVGCFPNVIGEEPLDSEAMVMALGFSGRGKTVAWAASSDILVS